MSAVPRVAICADFREEGWPSMDRIADQLMAHLSAEHAGANLRGLGGVVREKDHAEQREVEEPEAYVTGEEAELCERLARERYRAARRGAPGSRHRDGRVDVELRG